VTHILNATVLDKVRAAAEETVLIIEQCFIWGMGWCNSWDRAYSTGWHKRTKASNR